MVLIVNNNTPNKIRHPCHIIFASLHLYHETVARLAELEHKRIDPVCELGDIGEHDIVVQFACVENRIRQGNRHNAP